MGHTVQEDGKIGIRCGGRLLLLDVGMSAWMADGPATALRCTSDAGLEVVTQRGSVAVPFE